MRLRIATFIVATVCVLGLTGCDPAPAIYSPAPAPSVTPIFKSDEEALAAAKEAYERYLDVTDRIIASGGSETSELAKVAIGDQLTAEIAGFKELAAEGLIGVGKTQIKKFWLQQFDARSTSKSIVVAYVCDDLSNVDLLDSSGVSVIPESARKYSLFEVAFDLDPKSEVLLVASKELWSESPC